MQQNLPEGSSLWDCLVLDWGSFFFFFFFFYCSSFSFTSARDSPNSSSRIQLCFNVPVWDHHYFSSIFCRHVGLVVFSRWTVLFWRSAEGFAEFGVAQRGWSWYEAACRAWVSYLHVCLSSVRLPVGRRPPKPGVTESRLQPIRKLQAELMLKLTHHL